MSRKIPSPFKYRKKWRGQVTLKNGTRPHADFETFDEARDWITDQLAKANTEHLPEIGGPRQASLAQALAHYAGLNTITKGGYAAEIDRINRYLEGAGHKLLKVVTVGDKRQLTEKPDKKLPKAFEAHKDQRLAQRQETCKLISALAKRSCSSLCTADIRRLMVAMETEGLSPSTIQKEVAMLKHLFNVAAKEWNWKGFENPCVGIKLGTSNQRFVFLTEEQKRALREALAECDNPYFWPIVEICIQTTLRLGSLLAMTRDNVDLEGRIAMLPSKTGPVCIPLSKKAVKILTEMPVHPSGKYFPMTGNAVDLAWDGVRRKINKPDLQFKDLRHLGATEYARYGMNSHQLQKVLGHKSTRQAEVYVNLVSSDTLALMDCIEPDRPVYEIPEPARGSGADMLKGNRTKRLIDSVVAKVKGTAGSIETSTVTVTNATEQVRATAQLPGSQGVKAASQPEEDAAAVAVPTETPVVAAGKALEGFDLDSEPTPPGTDHTLPLQATGTHGSLCPSPAVANNIVRFDFRNRRPGA